MCIPKTTGDYYIGLKLDEGLLTFSFSAVPYLARILGALIVARLVPVTVNNVPPLGSKQKRSTEAPNDESAVNETKHSFYSNILQLPALLTSCWEKQCLCELLQAVMGKNKQFLL